MIAQRTDWQVFPALGNRAKASVRLLSSFCLFSANVHFGRACQSSSRINSNAVLSSHNHTHADVCSALCHGSNPHRQPSLLHPTL